jgi:hypothetical protein
MQISFNCFFSTHVLRPPPQGGGRPTLWEPLTYIMFMLLITYFSTQIYVYDQLMPAPFCNVIAIV